MHLSPRDRNYLLRQFRFYKSWQFSKNFTITIRISSKNDYRY